MGAGIEKRFDWTSLLETALTAGFSAPVRAANAAAKTLSLNRKSIQGIKIASKVAVTEQLTLLATEACAHFDIRTVVQNAASAALR